MKLILLVSIIFLAFIMKKLIEPVVLHCCGNVKDFDHTSDTPPHRISRCLKSWRKPCTSIGSQNCCGGTDDCEQTREGGKCKKSDGSGFYIYDLNGVKMDYSDEDEKEDIAERKKVWRDNDNEDIEEDDLDFRNDYDHLTIMNYLLIIVVGVVIILLIIRYFLIKSEVGDTKESSYTYDKYLGDYGSNRDYRSLNNDNYRSSSRYSDYL